MKALKLCCLSEALDEVIDFDEYRASIAIPLLNEIKNMVREVNDDLDDGALREADQPEGGEA